MTKHEQLSLIEKVLYHEGVSADKVTSIIEEGDRHQVSITKQAETPVNSLYESLKSEFNVGDRVIEEGDRPLIAVGYADIRWVAHSGWIACTDGYTLNPDYYHLAPLASQTLMSNPSPPGVAHQHKSVGGQHQDASPAAPETPTQSVFGEYWIEQVYKTRNGKTYGPYLVQRWRDEHGRKRSRYLGKPPNSETPQA